MRARHKQRIRKSTKYIYTITAIVLLIISFISLFDNLAKENIKTQTQQIYKYTNKFNYDYKVNLIKNKFMQDTQLTDKSLAYVTDLIDTIDLNFNYEYLSDKESILKYTYSIIGKMQVIYSKDGEQQKIWIEEDKLLEEIQEEQNNKDIKITQNLALDLKEKNQLLNQFKQQMGMSIDVKYIITLKINILTNIEGQEVHNIYEPVIEIDLAEKTTKITGENNKEDSQYISKQYNVNSTHNVLVIIIDIIAIGIAIILIRYVAKSRVTNIVKNEFRQELNRILKLCQDKIVKVSTKMLDKPDEVINVKDFGEIVKVSEELFKPILYYLDTENEEAWFSVKTGTTVYRYILKK